MKAKVIETNSIVDNIKKRGLSTSAGQVSDNPDVIKNIQVAYPAGAASAMGANTPGIRAFNNGLILSVHEFTSGTYSSLRGIQNKHSVTPGGLFRKTAPVGIVQSSALATLLLPLVGYNRTINNRFNDNKISTWERGNQSILGMIGPVASDIVSGMMEKITGGIAADNNEQISTAGRSTYAGTECRTFTFTWDFLPKNADDLVAMAQVYHVLKYFSVGITRRGFKATEDLSNIVFGVQDAIASKIKDRTGGNDVKTNNSLATGVLADILNRTITVSNPYYFNIRKYDSQGADLLAESYAPCQIQSLSFSDPDGPINGLYLAPSMSSKYTLSVTFRELIPLTHGGI